MCGRGRGVVFRSSWWSQGVPRSSPRESSIVYCPSALLLQEAAVSLIDVRKPDDVVSRAVIDAQSGDVLSHWDEDSGCCGASAAATGL